LLLFFACILYVEISAQTFVGASSSPNDNGSQAGATVAITPPASMLVGDLVIIYSHYRGDDASLSINATGGQSWTSESTYSGVSNQTSFIAWTRYNGTWSANPSISGPGSNALTVVMYVSDRAMPAVYGKLICHKRILLHLHQQQLFQAQQLQRIIQLQWHFGEVPMIIHGVI
jgi:hypothetical protein